LFGEPAVNRNSAAGPAEFHRGEIELAVAAAEIEVDVRAQKIRL
jgi:hypothetical protein